MPSDTHRFVRYQFWYLHAEYLARVLVQNLVLMLQLVLFTVIAISMAAWKESATGLAIAFAVESLAASVLWNHSGRRQVQIRAYLMEVAEPVLGNRFLGWEHFLQRRRIASRLGSMWRLGTIGVFCALPLAGTLLLGILASPDFGAATATAACIFGILLLTTHPPVGPEQEKPDLPGDPKTP